MCLSVQLVEGQRMSMSNFEATKAAAFQRGHAATRGRVKQRRTATPSARKKLREQAAADLEYSEIFKVWYPANREKLEEIGLAKRFANVLERLWRYPKETNDQLAAALGMQPKSVEDYFTIIYRILRVEESITSGPAEINLGHGDRKVRALEIYSSAIHSETLSWASLRTYCDEIKTGQMSATTFKYDRNLYLQRDNVHESFRSFLKSN